jgi:hypothetical protein
MMLAATEAAQFQTLAVILAVIGLFVGVVLKKPLAVVAMGLGAAAGAKWIEPNVATSGNMINTDASPMTGAILAGAVGGLILYAVIAKRLA